MVEFLGLDFLALKVKVTQLCPTLCDPMDCSPPGSSVHGVLQASILKGVAIPFSRGSSQPRNQSQVSRIAGEPPGKPFLDLSWQIIETFKSALESSSGCTTQTQERPVVV